MELMQIKPFSSHDLHMNTSGMNMRAVATVVELTLEKPSNQYSLLFSSLESSKIDLLPVSDYAHARSLFNAKIGNLDRNSNLMLSHIVCHGVILGSFTPNGKLMAHTQDASSQDVQVQSFDELRAFHLSPVVDEDIFSLIKQGWGSENVDETMASVNKIADSVGMDTPQFGHAYVRFMTGLLAPTDVHLNGLADAAREMSVLIAKKVPKTLEILWSQIDKATGQPLPFPDWKQRKDNEYSPVTSQKDTVASELKSVEQHATKVNRSPSF